MHGLQHEELSIQVDEGEGKIRLRWTGKSTARTPGTFLLPFFQSIADKVGERKIQVDNDLSQLQHLNSSTLAAMIGVIRIFRTAGIHMRVLYDPSVGWQERSMDALRILEAGSSIIRFEANRHAG
jgi:ABC-type transporter Mla MlaB component